MERCRGDTPCDGLILHHCVGLVILFLLLSSCSLGLLSSGSFFCWSRQGQTLVGGGLAQPAALALSVKTLPSLKTSKMSHQKRGDLSDLKYFLDKLELPKTTLCFALVGGCLGWRPDSIETLATDFPCSFSLHLGWESRFQPVKKEHMYKTDLTSNTENRKKGSIWINCQFRKVSMRKNTRCLKNHTN